MITQQQLTIIGDRQAGKSYLLNVFAFNEARHGRNVLYECESYKMAAIRFDDLVSMAHEEGIELQQIRRSAGAQALQLSNGAWIRMAPPIISPINSDTHLMDNIDSHPLDCATRSIRTALR